MLLVDFTFDTGEETERRRKQKISLKIIIVVKQDMVEVRLTSQEIILYIYLSIPTSIIEAKQI